MKIDRLIGILSILLQKDKVTAPELAAKFEVSKRTINRDIDVLEHAGIPLFTTRGAGGGISIMQGYRMERTLLTSKDMQSVLAGLRSLDSVSGSHYYEQLMEKIQIGSTEVMKGRDYMLIDFSSWYYKRLTPQIKTIQDAIEQHHLLSFTYVSQSHEGLRKVEPYFLVFKWSNWYLWGWSIDDNDCRLYKLQRMTDMQMLAHTFIPRDVPMPIMKPMQSHQTSVQFTALFDPIVKWRVVDEFSPKQLQVMDDGHLLLEGNYSDIPSLVQWLLSFGNQAELLKPKEARESLLLISQQIAQKYRL